MKWIALIALGLTCVTAYADDAHKVNFRAVMTDAEGQTAKICVKADDANPTKCADNRDLTLGYLALMALTAQEKDESGEDQVRRALLAQEVYKNGEVALDSKDTDLLCTAIAKAVNRAGMSASFTLQAWQLLDPARIKK